MMGGRRLALSVRSDDPWGHGAVGWRPDGLGPIWNWGSLVWLDAMQEYRRVLRDYPATLQPKGVLYLTVVALRRWEAL
jgi:hypothetical protein